MKTEVDLVDGYINMKKLEAWINTITPTVTYTLRCNTDITSLLSGTSIKAVVAYISDYITKPSLKIYHMFDTVKNIINKQTDTLGCSAKSKKNMRTLIMQMVNSLRSKLQIGSPMACLYLLENPDHYTNLAFKVFWWKSYVSEVAKSCAATVVSNVHSDPTELELAESEDGDENDRVVLQRADGEYVGTTNVDDYMHRPSTFDNTSLYELFQMTTRKNIPRNRRKIFWPVLRVRRLMKWSMKYPMI
ncbi:hypothetical protein B0H13DRAFT_1710734 [Mycena leptocephala]|nr:hypothetical protein B0H13DRAFT_1710734 [Mycena leptocephala]